MTARCQAKGGVHHETGRRRRRREREREGGGEGEREKDRKRASKRKERKESIKREREKTQKERERGRAKAKGRRPNALLCQGDIIAELGAAGLKRQALVLHRHCVLFLDEELEVGRGGRLVNIQAGHAQLGLDPDHLPRKKTMTPRKVRRVKPRAQEPCVS